MTLLPLTIRPVSAVLTVQPTPAAVVGAPDPDVVDDHVVAVDHAGWWWPCRRPRRRSGRTRPGPWSGWRRGSAVEPAGPTCSSTGELVVPASNSRPAILTPSTSATVIGGDAVVRDERGEAEAEHDGVGPGHVDGLVDVVDARGEEQVQALRQRRVDGRGACRPAWRRRTGSAAARCPAVAPPAQVAPAALVRSDGHEHLVVAGRVDVQERLLPDDRGRGRPWCTAGSGSCCAGAPGDADEDHVPDARRSSCRCWLSRVNHCCCEHGLHRAVDPAVGDVAAAGPAVAVRGQVRGRRGRASGGTARPARPPTGRRRPTGLIGRFSAERQKFWVALPPNQPASTVHVAVDRDVVGVAAEARRPRCRSRR